MKPREVDRIMEALTQAHEILRDAKASFPPFGAGVSVLADIVDVDARLETLEKEGGRLEVRTQAIEKAVESWRGVGLPIDGVTRLEATEASYRTLASRLHVLENDGAIGTIRDHETRLEALEARSVVMFDAEALENRLQAIEEKVVGLEGASIAHTSSSLKLLDTMDALQERATEISKAGQHGRHSLSDHVVGVEIRVEAVEKKASRSAAKIEVLRAGPFEDVLERLEALEEIRDSMTAGFKLGRKVKGEGGSIDDLGDELRELLETILGPDFIQNVAEQIVPAPPERRRARSRGPSARADGISHPIRGEGPAPEADPEPPARFEEREPLPSDLCVGHGIVTTEEDAEIYRYFVDTIKGGPWPPNGLTLLRIDIDGTEWCGRYVFERIEARDIVPLGRLTYDRGSLVDVEPGVVEPLGHVDPPAVQWAEADPDLAFRGPGDDPYDDEQKERRRVKLAMLESLRIDDVTAVSETTWRKHYGDLYRAELIEAGGPAPEDGWSLSEKGAAVLAAHEVLGNVPSWPPPTPEQRAAWPKLAAAFDRALEKVDATIDELVAAADVEHDGPGGVIAGSVQLNDPGDTDTRVESPESVDEPPESVPPVPMTPLHWATLEGIEKGSIDYMRGIGDAADEGLDVQTVVDTTRDLRAKRYIAWLPPENPGAPMRMMAEPTTKGRYIVTAAGRAALADRRFEQGHDR